MSNKKLKAGAFLVVFMVAWFSSFSQEKKVLTLQDAITLSIKNSKTLKAGAARIEQATAAYKAALQQRLPDASASGSYLRVNNPAVSLKTKTTSSGTGTQAASPKVTQAAYGMLNVSMPLYEGSRIKYGIESSNYLQQAEKLDADNDREGVIFNTIDAYNNLYKAQAAVLLVEESLQQSHQRDTDFSNLEKNGLLARNDLLKAELQSSNIELSLLDAQNNQSIANLNMNLMLGLPDSTENVIDSASLVTASNVESLDTYLQSSIQNRKDLEALTYRKKATDLDVKSAQSSQYPGIALTGGYVALDVPNFVSVINAVNIGIGAKYNIASLWKNAGVTQAKARVKEVEANEEALTDAIHLQINQAYHNYLLSQKKIDVYANAVAQASENYNIEKNKYDNGLETVTNLLDADVAQLQAKLNYAFAKSDAAVAYKKLLQTAGSLTNQ